MCAKKNRTNRRSVLDTPRIRATMLEYAEKKSAHPHSHRFSYKVLAVDILRLHRVQIGEKSVRTEMQRLGADGPWRRRPRGKKIAV